MDKTIVILDHQLLFREEIKLLIENEGFVVLVDEIKNGTDYLDISKTQQPDFVVINTGMKAVNWMKENGISIISLKDLNIFDLIYPCGNINSKDVSKHNRMMCEKKEFESSLCTILSGINIYPEQSI